MVNITGIRHRNLIQLKGCCVREKQKRMLVYEFAENKSLAEALWDIKPQNILLDEDYNAKIADFGLVRPAHTDDTLVTVNIGGTRGYFSPEYATEGVVSEKLEIYSFGIVLLEIVSGRLCINYKMPVEQIYLRGWAMTLYEEGNLMKLVDKELMGAYDVEEVLLVLETALSCLQMDPKKRPSMSQVVNMLMKHADVAIEIVKELRGKRTSLEGILEDDMRSNSYSRESEERTLISSSQSNSQFIELTEMHPR
ncbi:hypothetical protein Mapa_004790 [Marchantia paleacea]|nr:hypothetical protein Mapa_004790 [Marchantia paleacea]